MAKAPPEDWELQIAMIIEQIDLLAVVSPNDDVTTRAHRQKSLQMDVRAMSSSQLQDWPSSSMHSSTSSPNSEYGTLKSNGERVRIMKFPLNESGAKKCLREAVLLRRNLGDISSLPSKPVSNLCIPYGLYSSSFSPDLALVTKMVGPFQLSTLLDERSYPLTAQNIRQILVSVLSALDFLHANGIAHCAVKPENIYLHSCGSSGSDICGNDCDWENTARDPFPHGDKINAQLAGLDKNVEFLPTLSSTQHLASNSESNNFWMSPELCLLALRPKSKSRRAKLKDCIAKSDVWSVGILALTLIEHSMAQKVVSQSASRESKGSLNSLHATSSAASTPINATSILIDESTGCETINWPKSTFFSTSAMANLNLKQMKALKGTPSLFHHKQWSPICHDFVQACLRLNPANRPTVSELSKHPFLAPTAKPSTMILETSESEGSSSLLDDTYDDSTSYIPAPDEDILSEHSSGSAETPESPLRTSGLATAKAAANPLTVSAQGHRKHQHGHIQDDLDDCVSDEIAPFSRRRYDDDLNDDSYGTTVVNDEDDGGGSEAEFSPPSRKKRASNTKYGKASTSHHPRLTSSSSVSKASKRKSSEFRSHRKQLSDDVQALPSASQPTAASTAPIPPITSKSEDTNPNSKVIVRTKSKKKAATDEAESSFQERFKLVRTHSEMPSLASANTRKLSSTNALATTAPNTLRDRTPSPMKQSMSPPASIFEAFPNMRRSSLPLLPLAPNVRPPHTPTKSSPGSSPQNTMNTSSTTPQDSPVLSPATSLPGNMPSLAIDRPVPHGKSASLNDREMPYLSKRSRSDDRIDVPGSSGWSTTLSASPSSASSSAGPLSPLGLQSTLSGSSSSGRKKKKKKWYEFMTLPSLVGDAGYEKDLEECDSKWSAEIRKRYKSLESREKELKDKAQSRLKTIHRKYESQLASIKKRDELAYSDLKSRYNDQKKKINLERQYDLEMEETNEPAAYSRRNSFNGIPSVAPDRRAQFPHRVLLATHSKALYELDKKQSSDRHEIDVRSIDEIAMVEREFEVTKYYWDLSTMEFLHEAERQCLEDVYSMKIKLGEEIKSMTRKYISRRVKKLTEAAQPRPSEDTTFYDSLAAIASPRILNMDPKSPMLASFEVSPQSLALPSFISTFEDRYCTAVELQRWKLDEDLLCLGKDVQLAEDHRSATTLMNERHAREISTLRHGFEILYLKTQQSYLCDRLLKSYQHETELIDLKYTYQLRMLGAHDYAMALQELNQSSDKEHQALAATYSAKRSEINQMVSEMMPFKQTLPSPKEPEDGMTPPSSLSRQDSHEDSEP